MDRLRGLVNHLVKGFFSLLTLAAISAAVDVADAEVVRGRQTVSAPVGQRATLTSADREKLGQVSSPFPACDASQLVDADQFKKHEAQWRQISLAADFKGPIELVPSTSMFKSFNGAAAAKPGALSPTQFLESVGQRAVYDLNSGLEQYRDLKTCVENKSVSMVCEKLKEGFKRGFERNVPALRNALARSSFVESLYVSRAVAMNDSSDFVNSRMELQKAGVFGASPHRPLSGEELSLARADVRRAFDKAKKDYYEMVEARLAERLKEGGWTKDIIDRERLTMTSPQALTAAIGSRMAEYRAERIADYYRAMTESPQLAYSTGMPKSDAEFEKIINKMIADGESQLKRTEETLQRAKASSQSSARSRGSLTEHHLKLAGYSSTIEKVLREEALHSQPKGRPIHCGLAVGLHNELLASQSADGLLIAGALITAPIGAAIAVPRLAMAVGASSFATGAGLSSIVVGTGISSGLLSAGRDFATANSALKEVRTGLRTAEDARASVSAANLAAIGVATSAALSVRPAMQVVGKAAAGGRRSAAAFSNIPAPIKETVGQSMLGKVMDVSRLKSSMKLIRANADDAGPALSQMDDGIYIYGIDRKGNLAIIPRNLDPGGPISESSTFIGSHLGLRAAMKDALGEEIEFVAAGEIVQRNGRTMAVTNGAGSFKNGTENLNFSVEQLKQRGLKLDGRTDIRDFSKNVYEDPHDLVSAQVPREIKVLRDPVLRDLHKETSGLVARVDAKGVATGDEFFERALALEGVDTTAAYHAASLYRRWQNPAEGTAYSFDGIYSHIGPEKYREALNVIQRVAGQ